MDFLNNNLIKNNKAKMLLNIFIETFWLISLNHCQSYSTTMRFYLNDILFEWDLQWFKEINRNISINMFYRILALGLLFLIKLFLV